MIPVTKTNISLFPGHNEMAAACLMTLGSGRLAGFGQLVLDFLVLGGN